MVVCAFSEGDLGRLFGVLLSTGHPDAGDMIRILELACRESRTTVAVTLGERGFGGPAVQELAQAGEALVLARCALALGNEVAAIDYAATMADHADRVIDILTPEGG